MITLKTNLLFKLYYKKYISLHINFTWKYIIVWIFKYSFSLPKSVTQSPTYTNNLNALTQTHFTQYCPHTYCLTWNTYNKNLCKILNKYKINKIFIVAVIQFSLLKELNALLNTHTHKKHPTVLSNLQIKPKSNLTKGRIM